MTSLAKAEGSVPFHQGLAAQIGALHEEIRSEAELAHLGRIAVALYDPRTDLLKTFIHSSDGESPLDHATAPLSALPSLVELARTGGTRILNDLEAVARTGHEYAARLVSFGYYSSYTVPISGREGLRGFLFLNGVVPGFFAPKVVRRLKPYGDLIAQMVLRELDALHSMQSTVKVLLQISAVRDGETGCHLARMARYSRAIGLKLAGPLGFSDEFVEYLFQFAPVHDVGKISVPDHILLKPGPLTPEEFAVMQGHVIRGVEIVDLAVGDFGFISTAHLQMLRQIVACHHEKIDGSGYPRGLKGADIPLEARIVAVADVFDALTSRRPYKSAWNNADAIAALHADVANNKLDGACVAALVKSMPEILDIQVLFAETGVG
ncbi:HD-GYP domain-containing protein [Magnetospirillum molischianum]|uniref:HD-GYP domain n=1 Tax=Magnetospirillum molischianum DSM 120 TaxID=1150626 RepID=H8FRB5_MAGML|nr:HD domain-containing phosphohydrolase [Magnetospirillum molischianum]CCG40903.1 HD-GYP domain [Magnetospirillum molischianum DSM 120]